MTSSEGVAAMARQIEALGLTAAWSKAAFVIIHERIGATLQSVLASQSGGGVERLACCLPDDDSMVVTISVRVDKQMIPVIGMNLKRLDSNAVGSIAKN